MRETLSAAEARRVTLAAQGLPRAERTLAAQGLARAEQPATPGTRHLQSVMRRLGVVQIDSVNVFARAHYVPFFSRLGPYDPAALDRLVFGRRGPYVEYLAHEASLIPITDWGLWRFRMDAMRASYGGDGSWFENNAATVEWVRGQGWDLAQPHRHGPHHGHRHGDGAPGAGDLVRLDEFSPVPWAA